MAKKETNVWGKQLPQTNPKRRPGQHAKSYSKRKPPRKKYRGQGYCLVIKLL